MSNLEEVVQTPMQHEKIMQHEKFLKCQRDSNNKSSEGEMVLAEDGQEVHTGTRRSTRTIAEIFLLKMFMEVILCSISDPRFYEGKRIDPNMHSFNEAEHGEFYEQY